MAVHTTMGAEFNNTASVCVFSCKTENIHAARKAAAAVVAYYEDLGWTLDVLNVHDGEDDAGAWAYMVRPEECPH